MNLKNICQGQKLQDLSDQSKQKMGGSTKKNWKEYNFMCWFKSPYIQIFNPHMNMEDKTYLKDNKLQIMLVVICWRRVVITEKS